MLKLIGSMFIEWDPKNTLGFTYTHSSLEFQQVCLNLGGTCTPPTFHSNLTCKFSQDPPTIVLEFTRIIHQNWLQVEACDQHFS